MRQSVPPCPHGRGGRCDTLAENPGRESCPRRFNRRHFIAAGTAAAAMPFVAARRLGAGRLAVAANPHGLQLSGGRADRPAGARLRRIHRQAGRADRRHREQGRRFRLDRRGGSRARGARRPHHPVLDLDHLRDEPGDDEESRLRHGQGPDAGQRHSGRRAAAGREPEVRRQVAGRFRRLRAQEGQGELRHLQRGLGAAHDDQRTQQAVWAQDRADPLPRRSADVDGAAGRHARCRDGQLHGRAVRAAEQSRHGVRGAFEEGRCDPRHQDAARTRRDLEILHRERLLRLGGAEGDAAADRRPAGGTVRRRQQRSEGEGGSRDVRAGAGASASRRATRCISANCRSGSKAGQALGLQPA